MTALQQIEIYSKIIVYLLLVHCVFDFQRSMSLAQGQKAVLSEAVNAIRFIDSIVEVCYTYSGVYGW